MPKRGHGSFLFGLLYGIFGLVILPLLISRVNIWYHLPNFSEWYLNLGGIFSLAIGGCILGVSLIEYFNYDESILPTEKPKHLVTTGIYKYSRNPIFVAATLIWLGESLLSGELLLFIFTILATLLNHYHVVAEDEKSLKKLFGEKYEEYRKKTPRYIPRVHF